jgi:hypothetical protein
MKFKHPNKNNRIGKTPNKVDIKPNTKNPLMQGTTRTLLLYQGVDRSRGITITANKSPQKPPW